MISRPIQQEIIIVLYTEVQIHNSSKFSWLADCNGSRTISNDGMTCKVNSKELPFMYHSCC